MVSKKIMLELMDEIAPLKNSMDWDNCGLLVDANEEINGILVCLDVTKAIIDEADKKGCNLIISHHPVIFKEINKISSNDIVFYAVKKGISIYSAHTNIDIADDGLNHELANILELIDIDFMNGYDNPYKKIVVNSLADNAERIKQALVKIGAGEIGEYSECMFEIKGIGSFRPSDKANPHIGEKNKLGVVDEIKIECICESDKVNSAIKAIKEAHDYEHPAVDIFTLDYPSKSFSFGRIGKLKKTKKLSDFAVDLKEKLNVEAIRISGNMDKNISKVAVCCGSGADMTKSAFELDADVLVTGEIKHNHYIDAELMGLSLIDAGHYDTEKHFMELIIKSLQHAFDSIQCNVAVSRTEIEKCPYEVI